MKNKFISLILLLTVFLASCLDHTKYPNELYTITYVINYPSFSDTITKSVTANTEVGIVCGSNQGTNYIYYYPPSKCGCGSRTYLYDNTAPYKILDYKIGDKDSI